MLTDKDIKKMSCEEKKRENGMVYGRLNNNDNFHYLGKYCIEELDKKQLKDILIEQESRIKRLEDLLLETTKELLAITNLQKKHIEVIAKETKKIKERMF